MSSTAVVLGGAAAYMLLILAVGLLASRNVHDSTDFIVAGRRLPLGLCTFTLFATWFGAGTCVGAAGAAYGGGFLAVIADPFGAALCLFLAGLFYVRVMRRMRLLTLPDFFARRFGPRAEALSGILIVPTYVGWVAAQFVGFGFILHTLTGIDTTLAIVLGAAIVLAYTMAGGMWAVTLTDFVQAIVLIIGLLLLVPVVLQDVGGWEAVRREVPREAFALLPPPTWKDWIWYLEAWLVIGIGSLPAQDLMQRALSARDERVAQWSSYLAGVMYLTVGLLPVLLGILGTLAIPGIADPEFILPELGRKYLHPVGLAIFVGALFSAVMSSADSALLAPASVLGQNVLHHFKADPTERHKLLTMRWAVLGTGLLALATALYFRSVYDLMVSSWVVLMVSLFVPLTAGIYWKRTNEPAAVASLLVGAVGWLVLRGLDTGYPADLMATALAGVTLAVVTVATAGRAAPRPLTDEGGFPVPLRDRLGTLGWRR